MAEYSNEQVGRMKITAFLEPVAYGSRVLDVLLTNISESDNNVDNLLKYLLQLQRLIKDVYWAYKFIVPEDNFSQIVQLLIHSEHDIILKHCLDIAQTLLKHVFLIELVTIRVDFMKKLEHCIESDNELIQTTAIDVVKVLCTSLQAQANLEITTKLHAIIKTLFTKLQKDESNLKSILTIMQYYYEKVKFQNLQIENWFYCAIFNKYLASQNDDNIINESLLIAAILLSINCRQCLQVCDLDLLMVKLNDCLSSTNKVVRQSATRVLMSVTLVPEIRAKIIPEAGWGIIAKLMAGLIDEGEPVNYRLFYMKCMTNLCEVPKIRQFVYENYHQETDNLEFFDKGIQKHYDIFVKVLKTNVIK